jgi:hypothetical protein
MFQNICTNHTIEAIRDKWQTAFFKIDKDIRLGSRVKVDADTLGKMGT